ncbi:MAG TPA: FliM/FliN family flagellar motor switch protein [Terriglobales bacterium]|nr:FliM/FliN family flagellar motor switch protein [Terriglobales bacterium]
MDKVLNQGEIDAMVRAARSGKSDGGFAGPVVQPWDIRQAGQIGREQLRAINQLHELFARNLTTSLGGFLRVVFDCRLVSAEHLTYREFLQRVPEKTYLASCDLAPFGCNSILQFDLGIALPIIDIMLGGEGKAGELNRDLTEIEEQIIEGIVRVICRDLQTSWQAINLEFIFGSSQQVSQAQRLMPPDEKNLCLSFELKLSESSGTLNVAVPAQVSNALLRKISLDTSYQRPRSRAESRDQLKKKLLDCPFTIELTMSHLDASLESLSGLATGDILPFDRNASTPAIMEVGEVPLSSATPVRVLARRAAQVLELASAGDK